MTTRIAIQGFITPFGEATTQLAVVDWNTAKFFPFGHLDGVQSFLRYNIFSGKLEAGQPTTAYVGELIGPPTSLGVANSGNLYFNNAQSNCGGLQQVDPVTLNFVEQWGIAGAFQEWENAPTDTIPANVTEPQDICACGVPNYDFMMTMSHVSGNKFAGFNGPAWFGGFTPPSTGLYFDYHITPNNNPTALVIQGVPGSGTCYGIGSPSSPGDTQGLTFFAVTVNPNGFAITDLGTLAPAAIDATYTQVYAQAACVDQTDGNIILKVNGQAGATQPAYILKVKATAPGTILWSIGVDVIDFGQNIFQLSSITHGKLCHYDAQNFLYKINTITGSFTTIPYADGFFGLLAGGGQAYNDTNGTLIYNAIYSNEGDTSPIPINGTPNSFEGWSMLYVDTPQPPVGGAVTFNRIWGNFDL